MAVSTKPSRAYPSLPAVGGDVMSHSMVLQGVREAIEIHERRTRNYLDSFVSVRELVDLGVLAVQGDQILNAVDTLDGRASVPDAALSSNVPLLNAANTFANPQKISGAGIGSLLLEDSTSAADAKLWRLYSSVSAFGLQTRTDANGAGATPITLDRLGTTVTLMTLTANEIELNGVAVTDYARLSQQNTFVASNFVSNTTPQWWWNETDASSGNRNWAIYATGGTFRIAAGSDGFGAVEHALIITGNTSSEVTSIALAADAITATGKLAVTAQASAADDGFTLNLNGTVVGTLVDETDAAANNRYWTLPLVSGEQLTFGVYNDAFSTYTPWLTVDRTGAVVDSITLAATALAFNSAVTVTLADGRIDVSGVSVDASVGFTTQGHQNWTVGIDRSLATDFVFSAASDYSAVVLRLSTTGVLVTSGRVRLFGYTVATLPAGTVGDTAYVTDALAPVFGAAVAAGGAVMVPVYYTGAAWFVG